MRGKEVAREWSPHDAALWHTCEIAVDLAAGRVPVPGLEVLAPFPPRIATGERFWASGEFVLADLRAPGDGNYTHSSGFFFATGGLGLAATAAFAVGQAAGNRSRRESAAAAMVPRWTPVARGIVYPTHFGFYLQSAGGLLTWSYPSITGAEMVAPRQVNLYGDSEQGPVNWILESDWAELVFVTWALTHHPRHPQLVGGGWLPPDWLRWCAAQGFRTRLSTPVISAG